ncbi:hypothetical protein [Kribbella sp. CA-293567]|uniref:hypothetical protein n=1 Tax=Kribbella sp. CA-293567 TaxID=3002436 RepID=UPI0022DDE2CE|nr:hypothetical protein [Kribbella sp. CA-293567]WBQ06784.1 hypothetical protein OX958_08310 [Kribbella sp. CA-293567]
MKTTEAFILDSDGWEHPEVVRACGLILRTVEFSADRWETDVPGGGDDWTPEVAAAAEVLRQVASRNGRVEGQYDYAETGVMKFVRDEVWSAFVTFAPWAYDATVWSDTEGDIVSLSDEGQSAFVRLTPAHYATITAELGEASLVPYRKWRKVRKSRR